MTSQPNTALIRALNDRLRTRRSRGQMLVTRGLASLGPDYVARVMDAIVAAPDPTEADDPYGEHDFGSLEIDGQRVFWKIDYYDPTLSRHSDDPADEHCTTRVMTIMLAEEY